MIFRQKKKATCAYEVEQRKAEILNLAGGENATVDSVMSVLFGTRLNNYEDNHYFVYGYDDREEGRKWWQRLNALWVIPSVMVFLFPIQWVLTGRVGVKENTKFGRVIINLIGKD